MLPPDHADVLPPVSGGRPLRVVITLTGRGGQEALRLARQAGWHASLWPGLTFEPTGEGGDRALLRLGDMDWLLLTSPQGTRSFQSRLERLGLGPEHLAGVQVAAVGEGTALGLSQWGRRADFVPSRADAQALAAELPALPGQVALHVTGEASSDVLERGLQERGVVYRRLNLYRTRPISYSPQAIHDLRAADWILLASGVAAQGVAQQVGTGLRVVAMGEQTAQAARQAGFTEVRVAAQPTLTALLAALPAIG
ncbi:uroporphyrinogen-III synthase [Deinococcus radiophilus]|nr:uroporphyrinogen-III synthase [Deinococcus radiophilus]UFA50614.1 uroporphyrinogen-III synthase [Deinococcus radiophilus]